MAENKFSSKKFTASRSGVSEDYPDKEEKPFVRDDSDNKLFPEIQVKDPLEKGIITKDTTGEWDFDTPIYRIAQTMENKYLYVECKTDPSINDEIKNKTEFKGRGKKVSESSWLGLLNTEREVQGLEPLTPDDFILEERQKLKYDEDKAFEQAKILIYKKLKDVKLQYGLSKINLHLGEGDNFRNKLPTVRKYKGNRVDSVRPLLLKKLRKWLVDELGAKMAIPRKDGEMIECDDHIEIAKSNGYQHYRKHGWLSKVAISSDKDSLNSSGGVINPDLHVGDDNPLKGKFKFPQMMLIEATDRCTGNLDLISTSGSPELKGYGFKFLMAQACLNNDSADNYDALGHLKDAGYDLQFGTQSAYKVLQPCETVKETLQETINTFAELLPYGVEYTDCHGDEHDVDTITYMNTYFLVAYMSRSLDDKMDFFKLCKAFKVDISAIENNNLWTAPYEVVDVDKLLDIVQTYDSVTDDLNSKEFKSYKSDKKDGLVNRLDIASESLSEVREYSRNNVYKLVQRNKKTGEIRDFEEK